ncbi:serine/threonine-protein kinase [Actinomadura parmotrematis]|uniref:Serine/threonine protein kinase n=1 Tax=Actinomadura parmotrematis TaxID=2864039 RepID=A0ABS7FV11_9ACTN|nr:serine/threonine-protein kinase [Actinomadura parmotrematis]MBW8484251.1 serine/threonine protein kinase [Actinomadura parmotrematis]
MTTHTGDDHPPLLPGDPPRLGPYRLTGRLGQGGMGTVYLGADAAGRTVAVKVINQGLAGEAAFRERFRREVTAAGQVRRFCTAPVIGAELDRDPLYVVTEYIEGPSLERAVAERGPLPGSDLEGLAVGIATALRAIHAAGIVHRDLKPANVLLSATGPRVIDFGIARALDAAEGPTRTGQFVGTPNYLPPELLRGEPVTPASDVFSWGCVVAYAGLGTAPFAGSTVPEIFYRVAHEPPRLDGLDPGLRRLVEAALDKDPRKRPSVEELLARLVGQEAPSSEQLAHTVQASWHAPDATLLRPAETTRNDNGPAPGPGLPAPRGAGLPRKPLAIGAGVLAAVLVAGLGAWALLGSDGPPSKLATVFGDTFSDTGSGWDGGAYVSSAGYKDGRYRMETDSITETRWKGAPKKADDLPLRTLTTVTAYPVAGSPDSAYGVYCAGADSAGYEFWMRRDGKGLVLQKSSKDRGSKALATADSVGGFHGKGANKLQLACEWPAGGGTIRVRAWVNGHRVADVTDTDRPLPNGSIGIGVRRGGNASQQATVDFDDVDISKILD